MSVDPGLRELYQEMIVDHSKRPRNFGRLAKPTRTGEGHNPLCGDRIHIELQIENGVVREVKFEGSGCAISTASASMMTEALMGKTLEEAERLFQSFHDLVTGKTKGEMAGLGKLEIFSGVQEFPARVKCASLCWHTVRKALQGDAEVANTEIEGAGGKLK